MALGHGPRYEFRDLILNDGTTICTMVEIVEYSNFSIHMYHIQDIGPSWLLYIGQTAQ